MDRLECQTLWEEITFGRGDHQPNLDTNSARFEALIHDHVLTPSSFPSSLVWKLFVFAALLLAVKISSMLLLFQVSLLEILNG